MKVIKIFLIQLSAALQLAMKDSKEPPPKAAKPRPQGELDPCGWICRTYRLAVIIWRPIRGALGYVKNVVRRLGMRLVGTTGLVWKDDRLDPKQPRKGLQFRFINVYWSIMFIFGGVVASYAYYSGMVTIDLPLGNMVQVKGPGLIGSAVAFLLVIWAAVILRNSAVPTVPKEISKEDLILGRWRRQTPHWSRFLHLMLGLPAEHRGKIKTFKPQAWFAMPEVKALSGIKLLLYRSIFPLVAIGIVVTTLGQLGLDLQNPDYLGGVAIVSVIIMVAALTRFRKAAQVASTLLLWCFNVTFYLLIGWGVVTWTVTLVILANWGFDPAVAQDGEVWLTWQSPFLWWWFLAWTLFYWFYATTGWRHNQYFSSTEQLIVKYANWTLLGWGFDYASQRVSVVSWKVGTYNWLNVADYLDSGDIVGGKVGSGENVNYRALPYECFEMTKRGDWPKTVFTWLGIGAVYAIGYTFVLPIQWAVLIGIGLSLIAIGLYRIDYIPVNKSDIPTTVVATGSGGKEYGREVDKKEKKEKTKAPEVDDDRDSPARAFGG